jgi:hypothetical protein
MTFLGALADQISSQFSLVENTTHTLDAVVDGQNQKYGSLGDISQKIDQSAQRKYVEEGFLRRDPYNADPKQFEVLLQEPSATVMFKKRMFSSVAENFRTDYMDKEEKLFYKATKFLFQNKCRQIAALEKLSKIQKINSAVGKIDAQLVPIIMSLGDTIGDGGLSSLIGQNASNTFGQNKDVSVFANTVEQLRRVYGFNASSDTTAWITDSTNLFQTQYGEGTGVIEITNFTNLTTTTTVDLKTAGTFSVAITDPYEATVITDWDIEKAISDATNSFYDHKIYLFGQDAARKSIADLTNKLNHYRSLRKAGPITFKVNPDTLLGKRVTAIYDRIGTELVFDYDSNSALSFGVAGNGVTVKPEYLINGEVVGSEGLNDQLQTFRHISLTNDPGSKFAGRDSELTIFQQLVAAIFSKLSLDSNSRNSFQTANKNTNYVRRKMRFAFSGYHIIQPQDTVHIYMNSKSRFDNKILSGLNGLLTGNGILQNVNKTAANFSQSFDLLLRPSSAQIQAEKSVYVGANFPNSLWALIRNQFVSENEGAHVFAGVVEGVSDSWSDGKFSLNISGRDNTAYFDQGKVNFKPGVDTFNGAIFDPLTPFKSKFDNVSASFKNENPELLDENKYLLGDPSDANKLLKFKLGPFAGQPINSDNYIQDKTIDPKSKLTTRVFYAPDGLVYKWKEGIGVFTQYGNSTEINDPNKVGAPNIYDEPFAGQDIMNVLSLLVTGQPYNFATYWRYVKNPDGFNSDPNLYFEALSTDLTKRNSLWGNFIPFKNLVVDDQSFSKALMSQFTTTRRNQQIDEKIKKLNDLNNKAQLLNATNVFQNPNEVTTDSQVRSALAEIQSSARQLQKDVNASLADYKKEDADYLVTVGDETTFDYGDFLDNSKVDKKSGVDTRQYLRRQVNHLTRRMSYNVRANTDNNLFIVDDYYDKDYDIIAYSKDLVDGLSLYNNDFNSVRDKIINTANLLNLEVFCDTQGHIRVRPPQYNRMPSSVFYRMMYLKKTLNVQVFPQFLDDIFNDQISTLKQRVELIELQIRLDCAMLGYGDDDSSTSDISAQGFILGAGAGSLGGVMKGSGEQFTFLSDRTGNISGITSLDQNANPDSRNIKIDDSLKVNVNNQAVSNKDIFTNVQRFNILQDALTKQKLNSAGYSINQKSLTDNQEVDRLIGLINQKSGQKINKYDYVTKSDAGVAQVSLPANAKIDVFKVTEELSTKIKERQRAVKLFNSAIKNASEFKSLDADDGSQASSMMSPGTYGNSNIPEVFEHMIEDESYDDYGPRSGSRYIIKRAQIKSMQITVTPPDYTMVQVNGVPNQFDKNFGNSFSGAFTSGGNGLVSAVAVDYDQWRNYGFKNVSVITAPFLSDPESQCAPYASMILSRARKDILRGTIKIAGNEFMQPGEVVYLQDRNLLFYVNSVSHTFTYNGTFDTTLNVSYGHAPGEYIPTTMDFIGKMIYNNRDIASYVIQRQSNSNSEKNLGVIIKNQNNNDVINDKDSKGSYGAANEKVVNNILYAAGNALNANANSGNNTIASLELRIYYSDDGSAGDSGIGTGVDGDIYDLAKSLEQMLIENGTEETSKLNPTKPQNPKLPSKYVSIVAVNVQQSSSSPSHKAMDAARNIKEISGSSTNIFSSVGKAFVDVGKAAAHTFDSKKDTPSDNKDRDQIRSILFKYIIDCYIVFKDNTEKSNSNGGS